MKGVTSILPRLCVFVFLLISTAVVTGQPTKSSTTVAPTSIPVATAAPSSTMSTTTSLTPAMSAAAVSSLFAALASASPQQPGSGLAPGAGAPNDADGDSDAGASGSDSGSITLPTGAIIAIAVAVGAVIIIGITTATLWYFAKKRSWEIRASIRRSAKRVATAITPRRSTFPKDVQRSQRFSRGGLTRIDEVPNTPRTRSNDVEKGNGRMSAFEFTEPPPPGGKKGWGSKFGR